MYLKGTRIKLWRLKYVYRLSWSLGRQRKEAELIENHSNPLQILVLLVNVSWTHSLQRSWRGKKGKCSGFLSLEVLMPKCAVIGDFSLLSYWTFPLEYLGNLSACSSIKSWKPKWLQLLFLSSIDIYLRKSFITFFWRLFS